MKNDWNKPKITNTFHYKEKTTPLGQKIDTQTVLPMPKNPVTGGGRTGGIDGYRGNGIWEWEYCNTPRSGISSPSKRK